MRFFVSSSGNLFLMISRFPVRREVLANAEVAANPMQASASSVNDRFTSVSLVWGGTDRAGERLHASMRNRLWSTAKLSIGDSVSPVARCAAAGRGKMPQRQL